MSRLGAFLSGHAPDEPERWLDGSNFSLFLSFPFPDLSSGHARLEESHIVGRDDADKVATRRPLQLLWPPPATPITLSNIAFQTILQPPVNSALRGLLF